jgi:hypothetical protein
MIRRVIAVGALVVAFGGTAVAANGKPGRLGHTNKATRTTTLSDRKGTPLALVAKKGRPPLSVSGNTTEVPGLDASLLGGLASSSYGRHVLVFATAGLVHFTVPAGMHHALVTVVGGGGGGAGSSDDSNGGSGGQGGIATVWMPVTPGAKWSATVGAGGTGETNNTAGGDGAASLLRGSTDGQFPVEALGGGGGAVGADCLAQIGGAGGHGVGPTSDYAATVIDIRAVNGAAGVTGSNGCATLPGGDEWVAGTGGDGSSISATATYPDGEPGCVVVEFFA